MAKKQKLDLLDLKDHSLTKLPLPFAAGSVKEINCLHRLEYVPAAKRIPLLEELWRILEDGGKINVVVTYWTSPRAIQDPTAEWPPFCEQSFLYFNKAWRAQNLLPEIHADFDFSYGYQVDPETAGRNQETQAFWVKHYNNTATDLQLVLVKRP